jgi:hypothetical protein
MTEAWRGRTTGDPGGDWSVVDIRGDGTRPPGYIEHARQQASGERRPDGEIARELLWLIRKLAREPGNRILIMERVAGIERELGAR